MAELVPDSVSQACARRQAIADLPFARPQGANGCLRSPSRCGRTTALRRIDDCVVAFPRR